MFAIWSGRGFLGVIPLVVAILAAVLVPDESGGGFPTAVALLAGGVVGALGTHYADQWLERRGQQPQPVVDPETDDEDTVERHDTLLFVPMKWLWVPYVALAAYGAFALPGSLAAV